MGQTKKRLAALLTDAGGYVSGEKLSRRLNISRAAVWKNINALREVGFNIESATNRGYRLQSAPDILTEEAIFPLLGGSALGNRIICLKEVDSTNNYLKRLAEQGEASGTVVIADTQTAGRGRQGRLFHSPPGKGIYLSVLLRPRFTPPSAALLTAFSAVAVCEAIADAADTEPEIKWVNDVLIGEKKVCGILTELSLESESGNVQYIIVGAGVNLYHDPGDFPTAFRQKATSLYMDTGKSVPKAAFAAGMIRSLDKMAGLLAASPDVYLEKYRRLCHTPGRDIEVTLGGRTKSARAIAIGNDCGLIVEYGDGSVDTLRYGEISIRSAR